jgi:hypothetical protein
MPFFDDSGVRVEEQRGPLFGAFATLFDQIERMVALNVAWAMQLVPLLAALAYQGLPVWVRVPLILYSVVALGPATGALFGAMARACEGELLRLDVVRESLRQAVRPSLTTLVPLYSTFVWLTLLAMWAASRQVLAVNVLAQLALMLLGVCAVYWGPLVAARPDKSALAVLRESVRLAWRAPLLTVFTGVAVLLAFVIGAISIGGMFLVVPVLVALMETQQYRGVMRNP